MVGSTCSLLLHPAHIHLPVYWLSFPVCPFSEMWSQSNTSSVLKVWASEQIVLRSGTWSPAGIDVPPSQAMSGRRRRNWSWGLGALCWWSREHTKSCMARYRFKMIHSVHIWALILSSSSRWFLVTYLVGRRRWSRQRSSCGETGYWRQNCDS